MERPGGKGITERDRKLAQECIKCALCRDVEDRNGMPQWLLSSIERLCPYRRAYEKVYGLKAHEARPVMSPSV